MLGLPYQVSGWNDIFEKGEGGVGKHPKNQNAFPRRPRANPLPWGTTTIAASKSRQPNLPSCAYGTWLAPVNWVDRDLRLATSVPPVGINQRRCCHLLHLWPLDPARELLIVFL